MNVKARRGVPENAWCKVSYFRADALMSAALMESCCAQNHRMMSVTCGVVPCGPCEAVIRELTHQEPAFVLLQSLGGGTQWSLAFSTGTGASDPGMSPQLHEHSASKEHV